MSFGITTRNTQHWLSSARQWYSVKGLKVLSLSLLFLSVFLIQPHRTALQQIQNRGELVVSGISGPTTFYISNKSARGLQYELANLFAEELGVKLVLKESTSSTDVLSSIKRNKVDIGITGLATDDQRLRRLRTASPYMAVSEQLIQSINKPFPATIEGIQKGRIGVIKNSSEALRLQKLAEQHPNWEIIAFEKVDPLVLLEQLDSNQLDYVALNSSEFDARRALFPRLGVALNLQDYSELAWSFINTKDQSLFQAAQAFLAEKQADGTLDQLVSFYSQGNTFGQDNNDTFEKALNNRLPRYQALFEKNAARHKMDWRLLAAIAYQESHWQPDAVSPTGVTGIMMLTQNTASYFGVTDRTDVPQSIKGGARYFQYILNNLNSDIAEPDKTWLALASYNMGPGYIERARKRAFKAGDDGNKWITVSQHLRLMAKEARQQGRNIPVGQALIYVQQVRRYYDALLLASNHNIVPTIAARQVASNNTN